MPCIPSVRDITSLYPEVLAYLEMHCIQQKFKSTIVTKKKFNGEQADSYSTISCVTFIVGKRHYTFNVACFGLGMKEWTDSYLKSLEDKLSVQNTDFSLDQKTSSLELGDAMRNSLHQCTSKHAPKRVLIPQDLELSPSKKRFQMLSSNEHYKL